MGNLCCRRVVEFSPNGNNDEQNRCREQPQQQLQLAQKVSVFQHNAGDDCAINELLEGRMDLDVLLPDGRKVRLVVERRTPMMDLLVQTASATKISPAGHVIQVFGDDAHPLPFKPSTPVGSLDTNTICIVAKKDALDFANGRKTAKVSSRPFEPTFRVQVHLPRNQLTVTRVSPRVKISELRSSVCREKGLDVSKYQLVRPSDPGVPLRSDMSLSEYGSTEITLLSNACIESHLCNSTSHLMPYSKRSDEQKRKTGILKLLAEDAKQKAEKLKVSALYCVEDNQVAQGGRTKNFKKRRPAPPPPPSHSRQSSSDSSGYHEDAAASSCILHEDRYVLEKASSDSSGVSSLDAKPPSIDTSPVPPPPATLNTKKKKAPLPPVVAQDPSPEQTSGHRKAPAPPSAAPAVENLQKCPEKPIQNRFIKNPPEEAIIEPQDQKTFNSKELVVVEAKEDQDKNLHLADFIPNKITDEANKNSKPSTAALVEDDRGNAGDESGIPMARNHKNIIENNVDQVKSVKENAKTHLEAEPIVGKEKSHQENIKTIPQAKVITQEKGNGFLEIKNLVTPWENRKPFSQVKNEKATADSNGLSNPNQVYKNPQIQNNQTEPIEKAIDKSKNENKMDLNMDNSEPVSRSALAALHARIEQDLTQREIVSSIQAAFHSLDTVQKAEPSLLAIKQRHSVVIPDEGSSYPLQKSSALDFESNGHFPPPPTEFQGETQLPSEVIDKVVTRKTIRRSSSLLNLTEGSPKLQSSRTGGYRQLQRSLSDLSADDKEEFEIEQKRLHREYLKLQRQFVLWQRQLLDNHAMLREECIMPQYARTLRQSHSLPEGEEYSDSSSPPCPLVSRSLSYEPNKCSTLPRSTINIPEFGAISIKDGSTSLRSSKTKNYFKPPQVRISTKNRQRLPPEIRKVGDLDITDDNSILSTILPSFESLKLIAENNEDLLNLKNGISSPNMSDHFLNSKLEILKTGPKVVPPQVPNKLATLPKPVLRLNTENISKCNRGDDKAPAELITNGSHAPPPPPMPSPKAPTVIKPSLNGHKKNGVKKQVNQQVDTRDQLMQEIRRFGGRTALRKISLDCPS